MTRAKRLRMIASAERMIIALKKRVRAGDASEKDRESLRWFVDFCRTHRQRLKREGGDS